MNRRDFFRLSAAIAATPLAAKIIPISSRIPGVGAKSMGVLVPWYVYQWCLTGERDVQIQYLISGGAFAATGNLITRMEWSMYVDTMSNLPNIDDSISIKDFIDHEVKLALPPQEIWPGKFQITSVEIDSADGVRAHYRAVEVGRV